MVVTRTKDSWLVVLGFNTTLTAKVISWWSVTHIFSWLSTPVLTQLFFPKPPTTFLTCFCRGERRKYAGKKSCLNWGSNSRPPDHESDTLTTEPPGWDTKDRNHLFIKSKSVVCKSSEYGAVQKFVVRKRVKEIRVLVYSLISISTVLDENSDLLCAIAFKMCL